MKKLHQVNKKAILALLTVSLLGTVLGCTSADEAITPAKTEEYVSFKIAGKEYRGEAVSLGDEGYFHLWGIVEINANDGYTVQLEMNNPKIGTFTMPKNRFSATISSLKGTILNPSIQDYAMTSNGTGTVTFSKLDYDGYAEGTFSFRGQNDSGQKLDVTDGKFRIDLR